MPQLILFVIGLVLFAVVAFTLWWIIFGLGAPLWAKLPPNAMVVGKVLFALFVLLLFVYWLYGGMSLPFMHLHP